MLQKKTDETQASLEETIRSLEDDMRTMDPGSEDYARSLAHVERLYKLKEKNSPKRIDPNTWVIVGGNLAGILFILVYEHGHVITSKALSFAGKLK